MNGNHASLPPAWDAVPIDRSDVEPIDYDDPADMLEPLRGSDASIENPSLLLGLIIAIGCHLSDLPLESCATTGFVIGSMAGIVVDLTASQLDDELAIEVYPRKVRRS